jgi:alanine racemase
MRPTRAEIDLQALRDNLASIRSRLREQGGAEVIAVVKADAYGHGAVGVSAELLRQGVNWLAVASLEEAVELLEGLDLAAESRIVILGPLRADEIEEIARRRLVAVISSHDDLDLLVRAPGQNPIEVIVDLDTGMGRMGLCPEELAPALARILALPRLRTRGVFSHLSVADGSGEDDREYTRRQLQDFELLAGQVRKLIPALDLVAIANTGGIFLHPGAAGNAVRPGIGLYGVSPNPELELPVTLAPVMRWVTEIAQVRSLPAGSCISYGRRTVLARPSRIALLPVGYADGLQRRLAPGFEFMVRGRPAPISGVVTMDLTMMDVTDVPEARPGDRVLLLGRDRQTDAEGREKTVEVRAEKHARAARGITYEILTAVGKRVRREYLGERS